MRQVVFRIPLPAFEGKPDWLPDSIPIYGFGLMLFLALVLSTWLAGRRAERRGIPREVIQDLAIWVFVGGLIGARLVYMIQYGRPLIEFFNIWQGGIVFYGSLIGGAVGFAGAYRWVLKPRQVRWWPVADVIAPAAALGLAIGRLGCLMNGCCYGNVACEDSPAIHFPFSAPPRYDFVARGYQTAAGFTMDMRRDVDPRTVGAVEPGSPAAIAGLRAGDIIVQADQRPINRYEDLHYYLGMTDEWPRGKNDLSLTVERGGQRIELPAFAPVTIGLHPTQLYETISMLLLMLVLLAFEPLQTRDGQLMVLFLLCYPVHRFLNETLRTDTDPVAFGMTLSQNGSLILFTVALVLGAWLLWAPGTGPRQGGVNASTAR